MKLLVDSTGLCGQCLAVYRLSTSRVKFECSKVSHASFGLSWSDFRLRVGFPHIHDCLCFRNTWAGLHLWTTECGVYYPQVLCICTKDIISIYFIYILHVYTHTHLSVYKKIHLENCPKKQKITCFLPVSTGDFIGRMYSSEVLNWRWCPGSFSEGESVQARKCLRLTSVWRKDKRNKIKSVVILLVSQLALKSSSCFIFFIIF